MSRLWIAKRAFTTSSRAWASSETSLQVTDPLEMYKSMITLKQLQYDPHQMHLLARLRKKSQELSEYRPSGELWALLESMRSPNASGSKALVPEWLDNVEGFRASVDKMSTKDREHALVKVTEADNLASLDTPTGFLLTGPPGTGKSLIMDIFFESLVVEKKIRFHYHHFLLSLYSRINESLKRYQEWTANRSPEYISQWRDFVKQMALTRGWQNIFRTQKQGLDSTEFVLATVARDIFNDHGYILAFDEVQMVDVAGAGVIRRVLEWYWLLGGVVLATSNRLPQDLYQQGVQRESMASFFRAFEARCPAFNIDSDQDYRTSKQRTTFPIGTRKSPEARSANDFWANWSGVETWFPHGGAADFVDYAVAHEDPAHNPQGVRVYGRHVAPPWSHGRVAKFSFNDLCLGNYGAADYLALCSAYHTIILTDIPVLKLSNKNESRRLITLIDALYDTKTRLVAEAEVPIDELFFPDAVDTSIADSEASLMQEMYSKVLQDLEAPYRPNVSSYDETALHSRFDHYNEGPSPVAPPRARQSSPRENTGPESHPSNRNPAFLNLSIFSGEDERFAYKRAVSRLHEMTDSGYFQDAPWMPVDESLRPWFKPIQQRQASWRAPSMHPASPLFEEFQNARDFKERPKIKEDHIWGIRDDWGPRAGPWGQGVNARKK